MAFSSEPVTFQIEVLSKVHNENDDREKKDLKRKLAACQKELEEAREQIRQRRDEVNKVCKESRDAMHKVDLVLRQGVYERRALSKEQVNELSEHLCKAHNVTFEITDPGSSCGSSSCSDSEDSDEQCYL